MNLKTADQINWPLGESFISSMKSQNGIFWMLHWRVLGHSSIYIMPQQEHHLFFIHTIHQLSCCTIASKNIAISGVFLKVILSPPCLWASFHPPYPHFEWGPQSNEVLFNLGMKCWNSAFNAQGWRVIIVVVHVGAVKIYVAAAVGGAQEKGKKRGSKPDETQFGTKNSAFLSFTPRWRLMYLFRVFFKKISPGFGPNSGFWWRVFLTLRKTRVLFFSWPILRCSHKVVIIHKKNLAKFGYTLYIYIYECFFKMILLFSWLHYLSQKSGDLDFVFENLANLGHFPHHENKIK